MADPTGKTLLGVSKTTIQGWLTLLMVVGLQVSTITIPTALATPQNSHIMAWVSFAATSVAGLLKVIVAFLQGDAPNPPAAN